MTPDHDPTNEALNPHWGPDPNAEEHCFKVFISPLWLDDDVKGIKDPWK